MQHEVKITCAVARKYTVCWCYEVWTGKKGLTGEGRAQIIFAVKLKTLSCTRGEAEQHRALQLEPAAGLGGSSGVRTWAGGRLSLQREAWDPWDQPSEKSFQHMWSSTMSCQEFLFLLILCHVKLAPHHQNRWRLKAFRLLPKTFLKVSSDAISSNIE